MQEISINPSRDLGDLGDSGRTGLAIQIEFVSFDKSQKLDIESYEESQ
jgi:hypothetical protein